MIIKKMDKSMSDFKESVMYEIAVCSAIGLVFGFIAGYLLIG
jgi:hypothetical protein